MEKARALTYAVLHKAVCPSDLSRTPVLRDNGTMLDNFLDTMGVNPEYDIGTVVLTPPGDILDRYLNNTKARSFNLALVRQGLMTVLLPL